jgi:hypothetical protein
METIHLYHLVEGAKVAAKSDAIAKALVDGGEPSSGDVMFEVSESGCVRYVDFGKLWQMTRSSVATGEDATQIARTYLERARAALIEVDTRVLPADLRHVSTDPVLAMTSDETDHWLCQFAIASTLYLVSSRSPASCAPTPSSAAVRS